MGLNKHFSKTSQTSAKQGLTKYLRQQNKKCIGKLRQDLCATIIWGASNAH